MALSSNRGYSLSTQVITADIDLDLLDEVCLSDFFTEKLLLFFLPPPSYTVLFRRKSLFRKSFLGGSPHLGNKGVMPSLLKGRIFT